MWTHVGCLHIIYDSISFKTLGMILYNHNPPKMDGVTLRIPHLNDGHVQQSQDSAATDPPYYRFPISHLKPNKAQLFNLQPELIIRQ
jgi:hypothetical protein